MGSFLVPILGGFLLSITLPIHMNFIAFAIPGLIAAIALALVPVKHASKASNEIQAEVEPQTNVSST
jgi:MFS transporter, AAHS family, benzoate transport protein